MDHAQPLLIQKILQQPRSPWANLLEKMNCLKSLTQSVQAFLPKPLNEHCKVAEFTNQTVTLSTDASVWLARLRFLESSLSSHFQKQTGIAPLKVQIRLHRAIERPQNQAVEKRNISQVGRNHLACAAQSIEDPTLKEILLRLSILDKTQNKKPGDA